MLARVHRAAAALRRGRLVAVTDEAQPKARATLCLAVEELDASTLSHLKQRAVNPPIIALTANRAAVMRIRPTGEEVVCLPLSDHFNTRLIRSLADPTRDLDNPVRGPFLPLEQTVPQAVKAAIKLAKTAQLLPAVIAAPLGIADADSLPDDIPVVSVADILAYDRVAAVTLHPVSSARVPLEAAEHTRVIAFRPENGGVEHLAIVVGEPDPEKPVLARLHSECFTGDLLGSLKCDCGEQLRGALEEIAAEGAGVVLYMAQEGRGIGLINKLRAYQLQDQGFDTIDANERLGFEADERLFLPAAEMLRHLGFDRIRLMTNNPDKVVALADHGVTVTERVAHAFPSNTHNALYLATKAKRSGHYLTEAAIKKSKNADQG